jgi:hypothetical protein
MARQKNVLRVRKNESSWVRELRWLGESEVSIFKGGGKVEVTKLATRKTMRNYLVKYTWVNITRTMFEEALQVHANGGSVGAHINREWNPVQPK